MAQRSVVLKGKAQWAKVFKDNRGMIPKTEYERLVKADEFLECLYAAGVDNWSGYDDAREILKGEEVN